MQFAYLENTAGSAVDLMMGTLLQTIQSHQDAQEDVPEVELTDEWKTFRESLSKFQSDYGQILRQIREASEELKKKKSHLRAVKDLGTILADSFYVDKVNELVSNVEREENIVDFEEHLLLLKGTASAMKSLLEGTNLPQFFKFQCFVCMDKDIDTFLDPCGHVICTTCWRRNNIPNTCPGCRAIVRPKKIFTLL